MEAVPAGFAACPRQRPCEQTKHTRRSDVRRFPKLRRDTATCGPVVRMVASIEVARYNCSMTSKRTSRCGRSAPETTIRPRCSIRSGACPSGPPMRNARSRPRLPGSRQRQLFRTPLRAVERAFTSAFFGSGDDTRAPPLRKVSRPFAAQVSGLLISTSSNGSCARQALAIVEPQRPRRRAFADGVLTNFHPERKGRTCVFGLMIW